MTRGAQLCVGDLVKAAQCVSSGGVAYQSLVSDLARCWSVEHPPLNVTKSCPSAWMWIVTAEMTVPKFTTVNVCR